MTREEYEEYQETVARYMKGLEAVSTGPCPGCEECGLGEEPTDHEYDCAGEAGFSWSPCEICGSSLGGNRSPWHALIPATNQPGCVHEHGKMVHGTCCEDCTYYLNYGQLDDTTMADMETA